MEHPQDPLRFATPLEGGNASGATEPAPQRFPLGASHAAYGASGTTAELT